MPITRRSCLTGLAAAAAALAQRRPEPPVPSRSRPAICLYSRVLSSISYSELGSVLRDIGFDGVDLSVEPGGHIEPQLVQVDMLRAVEEIRGNTLDIPLITTPFTSANHPWARAVIGIAGGMDIPLFQAALAAPNPNTEPAARLAELRRDVMGLVMLGRAYSIAAALPDRTPLSVLADHDAQLVGYTFDPAHDLSAALPRLKSVIVRDHQPGAAPGDAPRYCPLGQGTIDFTRLFAQLAAARFTGPLSLHVDYQPGNALAAIKKDFEFLRKQVSAAWAAVT